MGDPEVTIIIPMLNNLAATKKCVEHVRNNTPFIYTIVIVAQESTPQTLKWLLQQHTRHEATVVLCPKRLNFSGAVNTGLKIVKTPYVSIIASDVYVRQGWLDPLLLSLLVHPELGWVTSQIIQADKKKRPFNISCCLISREAIQKVGLLDEQFNVGKGFEDDDWYWRFLKAGYKPAGVIESVADSPEDATTFKKTYNAQKIKEMHTTNLALFTQKWGFSGTQWGRIISVNVPVYDRYDWIRRNTSKKILDIGSSAAHTFKDDPRTVNFDLDLYNVPNFIRGDAHNLPFKNKSFHSVSLGDVLEHVTDPVQVLKEAKRVAEHVVLTVPDEKEKMAKHLMSDVYQSNDPNIHRQATVEWIRDNQPTQIIDDKVHPHLFHRRFFSEETLKQTLDTAGFLTYTLEHLEHSVPKPDGTMDNLKFFAVKT